MIELTLTKADVKAANYETLTTGMVSAVSVHFNFSRHWDGLTKIAVFTNGEKTVDVPDSAWKDRACAIPHEVLALPWRVVKCGVYGVKEGKIVLPAVWVSIGRVKPGADPSGDPETDPELPIWAHLESQINELGDDVEELAEEVAKGGSKSCFTYLVKNPERLGKNQDVLRVYFSGLDSLDGSPELRLFHCIHRRERKYHWAHPFNWNVSTDDSHPRLGYGLIEGQPFGSNHGNPPYPHVPEWMPNNGFIETVFPIDEEALERGYIDIPIYRWLVPMLKPIRMEELDWRTCGLIGLQGNAGKAPLLFQFRLYREDKELGPCRNTFCFGISRHYGYPQGKSACPYLDDNGYMASQYFYTSIR